MEQQLLPPPIIVIQICHHFKKIDSHVIINFDEPLELVFGTVLEDKELHPGLYFQAKPMVGVQKVCSYKGQKMLLFFHLKMFFF